MPSSSSSVSPVQVALAAVATSIPSSLTPEQPGAVAKTADLSALALSRALRTVVSKAVAGTASSDLVDVNELAGQIARDSAAQQVAAISAATRRQVARIISQGLDEGWSDTRIKQRIKDVVGLDPRSEQAVANYRDSLTKAGRKQSVIDRQVAAYSKRLLNRRAKLIADTETHKVLQSAQQSIWAQKQQVGELSPYAVRVFRTHKDERTCPVCKPLNGKRFSLQDTTSLPPLHPNCRCTSDLVDEGIAKADPDLIYKGKVIRHVRDVEFWGMPYGTPITPGMKPKGDKAKAKKRIGFVEDPMRRQEALHRAERVFENTKPEAKREFSSDYIDVAMKKYVNRLVAAKLVEGTQADTAFNDWLDTHTGADRGEFLLQQWKDRYAETVNRRAERISLTRQLDQLRYELEGQQQAAKDNAGNDMLETYFKTESDKTTKLIEKVEADLKAIPVPTTRIDYSGQDFRNYLFDAAKARGFDFFGENFIELDHLNNEQFADVMAKREEIANRVRKTVDNWASTSLDHDVNALALQYAVQQKWNVPGWDGVLDHLAVRLEGDLSPESVKRRRDMWKERVEGEYKYDKPYYDHIAQAIYDVTQERLKAEGVTELHLHRGMGLSEQELSKLPEDLFDHTKGADFIFNPLSSWSYSENTATDNFAVGTGGITFQITVPADRVFSSAVMGLGCLNEQEYVLLGGKYHVTAKSDEYDRAKKKAAGLVYNSWTGEWEKPITTPTEEQYKHYESYVSFIEDPKNADDLEALKNDIDKAHVNGKINQMMKNKLYGFIDAKTAKKTPVIPTFGMSFKQNVHAALVDSDPGTKVFVHDQMTGGTYLWTKETSGTWEAALGGHAGNTTLAEALTAKTSDFDPDYVAIEGPLGGKHYYYPDAEKKLTDYAKDPTDFGHLTNEDAQVEHYVKQMDQAQSLEDLHAVWDEVMSNDWYIENDAALWDTFKAKKAELDKQQIADIQDLLEPSGGMMPKKTTAKKTAKKAVASGMGPFLLKISGASTHEKLSAIEDQIKASTTLSESTKKMLLGHIEVKRHQIEAGKNK